ncbi:MAG TPA: TetR-like C-terminal domain-containing protein [Rhizomicrobium sp.]|jgi:AcrR family transcriptional regulator
MKKKLPAARPGGRGQRVRTAVFDAVEALMAENPRDIPAMGAIAARAGVNPTSLYRRWGDVSVLVTEVAGERLMQDNPMADTGSLRGDLLRWATAVARSLSGRKNLALRRVLASAVQMHDKHSSQILAALARRGQDLQTALERAEARGEAVPSLPDVLEIVLAPIYFRVLFLGSASDADDVARLIDRVMAMAR